MFTSIASIVGVVCSLMGLAMAYLLFMGAFVSIQLISKQRSLKQAVFVSVQLGKRAKRYHKTYAVRF